MAQQKKGRPGGSGKGRPSHHGKGSTNKRRGGASSSSSAGGGSGKKGRSGASRGSSSGKGRSGTPSDPRSRSTKGGKSQYSATTRSVEAARRDQHAQKRRRDLKGAAVNLPNWVIENLERVTPRDRVAPALEALGSASEALANGNYQAAVKHASRAKALSPQDATTRETLGIAAYRLGDWKTALAELRAYRRMQGETTHMPIEMDVLRAQGRGKDVEATWAELQRRGGHGLVLNEGRIVFASFLLDEGRADEAWTVVDPGRIESAPNEGHLRRYYVAARAAAALGDKPAAKRFADTIVTTDPSFPGWDELEAEISRL